MPWGDKWEDKVTENHELFNLTDDEIEIMESSKSVSYTHLTLPTTD